LLFAELEENGHIDQLYYLADWSGIGVASMLVDGLRDHAVSVGLHRVFVEASELALTLFKHKGFRVICRRDFKLRGIAMHNYAMELVLHSTVISD
jgi:putative acetyltransferase